MSNAFGDLLNVTPEVALCDIELRDVVGGTNLEVVVGVGV